MTLLERIDHYTKVFSIALPHVKAPTPTEAIRWCEYPQASVELAMLRAAKKFAPGLVKPGFDPTLAYQYITGTARLINGQSVSRVNVKAAQLQTQPHKGKETPAAPVTLRSNTI